MSLLQQKVLEVVSKIPAGKVLTYSQVALKTRNPKHISNINFGIH